MSMRAVKPPRWFVSRDIQVLIRTFPSRPIVIFRNVRIGGGSLGQARFAESTVFRGEALEVPATGTVEIFGLGQVENKNPMLLIAGTPDIRQGDLTRLNGRLYKVEFEPNAWNAFVIVRLEQAMQGT